MIFNNVKMAGTDKLVNIRVDGGKIANISSSIINEVNGELAITFSNAIVFPGLINSHDHLDFDLFPQLGDKIYRNYTEWGQYIHKKYKNEIARVLKIPGPLRYRWGVYKNLLCGVTTVVNHGERSGLENDLLTVFEETQSLHSVQFESGWRFKLNNPFKIKYPVTVHVGEGDDWLSFHEIDQLVWWNLLQKKLIGIHAVAMSETQADKFDAIVWCPQSNYFLLDKTARVDLLKKHTNLLFGTDSTLTSSWNIWEHFRFARNTKLLGDNTLYNTFNKNAAKIWQLNTGEIAIGKDADIVIAKTERHSADFDAFYAIDPSDLLLVVHKGNVRLFDEILLTVFKGIDLSDFSKVNINGAGKHVQGDLPGLTQKIREYYPDIDFPVSIEPNIDIVLQ